MDVTEEEKDVGVYVIHPPLNTEDIQKPISSLEKKKSFFHIDKAMIRYKLHYFLFEGAFAFTCPYFSIFAKKRIGLSATALAAILTAQQVLFIFTKPLIGYMTDYFNKLKAIIILLAVVQGVFFFLLLPINKIKSDEGTLGRRTFSFDKSTKTSLSYERCKLDELNKTDLIDTTLSGKIINDVVCAGEMAAYDNIPNGCLLLVITEIDAYQTLISPVETVCSKCCDVNSNVNCFALECQQSSNSSKSTFNHESQFLSSSFWMFAIFGTVSMTCVNSFFTLSDTALCEGTQKTGSDFGKQRVWGAFGWGLIAPIAGFLNDITNSYLVSFIVMGVFTAMCGWNVYKMDMGKPRFSQNILKDVGKVLSSVHFLAFGAGVFMNGIFAGIIWSYLIWFLTTIGGSEFLYGLVQAVECFIGELPFMFYSGWIIEKIGHSNALSFALLCYCIRFFWYSCLENPWLVLPIEVLHGVTYGLTYPNIASYAKKSAKPGTEATTQSILFSTHEGLGCGLGCVLAGIGFDTFGGHKTFFIAGICALCGMFINIIFTMCLHKKSNKTIVVTIA